MKTPKQRLAEAGHKLAGQAEYVEEIASDRPDAGKFEGMRETLVNALDKVKESVKEIEEIIK